MKRGMIILIVVIALIILLFLTFVFNQDKQNQNKWCHAVWEGKYTKSNNPLAGISAHENYEMDCSSIQTKEECENSIDLVNYSIARDSFNEGGDGLPDCEWK